MTLFNYFNSVIQARTKWYQDMVIKIGYKELSIVKPFFILRNINIHGNKETSVSVFMFS